MNPELRHLLLAVSIGVGATLVMDLWNLLLRIAFGIPSLSYCLLGRWLRHMTGGTFAHVSIASSPRKSYECVVGRVAHYTIGISLAIGLVIHLPADWLARPTFIPALLYGIGTVVFPYFIMQPAFGLGVAASKTPHPTQARLKSLATHTVFGIGLYLCALVASQIV